MHIRRVTRPAIRAPIAAVVALAGLSVIACSPLIVGTVAQRVVPLITAMVPVVTTGVYTAIESARAMRFSHPIDTYSSNWRRLDGPPGTGARLLELVNTRENAAGRTIGGQARHTEVVARHLAAGRALDAAGTMRTIATASQSGLRHRPEAEPLQHQARQEEGRPSPGSEPTTNSYNAQNTNLSPDQRDAPIDSQLDVVAPEASSLEILRRCEAGELTIEEAIDQSADQIRNW